MLCRQELESLVETLPACTCRRRRLCLFVFSPAKPSLRDSCMRNLLAVYNCASKRRLAILMGTGLR